MGCLWSPQYVGSSVETFLSSRHMLSRLSALSWLTLRRGNLMMGSFQRTIFLLVAFATAELASTQAWAVDPNPLESAYWRFEEGTIGQPVTPRNEPVVLDSINANHMQAFRSEDGNVDAAPTYTSDVAPT